MRNLLATFALLAMCVPLAVAVGCASAEPSADPSDRGVDGLEDGVGDAVLDSDGREDLETDTVSDLPRRDAADSSVDGDAAEVGDGPVLADLVDLEVVGDARTDRDAILDGDGAPDSPPDQLEEPDAPLEVFGFDRGDDTDLLSPTCGNFTVENVEQCDDGNTRNLDGCDSICRYEHVYRATRLTLQPTSAPAWCEMDNAFGRGLGTTTGPLNDAVAASLSRGDDMFALWLLDSNLPPVRPDPSLSVGVVGVNADGRSPVSSSTRDAWFRVPTAWLFGSGPRYRLLPGRTQDGIVRAGPSAIDLPFLDAVVRLRDARIRGRFGAATSAPNDPPVLLSSGFATPNELQGSDSEVGLCGGISVGTLARVPIPTFFTEGAGACSSTCTNSRAYVACDGGVVDADCNSLLDLMVSGCATVPSCALALVRPTQPDRPAVAGGVVETLVADPGTGKVSVLEPNDAYSAYFHYTGLRAHLTNNVE